jgi:hypothetical protein
MRRASTCLALLGLAVLGLPAAASAVPVVTFKAKAVPIPGFPHTGNILGAGAAEQVEWTIKGHEYGEFAWPLIGVKVTEPAGTKLHPQGFPICPQGLIEALEPKKCPKSSKLTIKGEALGVVSFGGTRVEEATTVEGFFAPNNKLAFFTTGSSPTSLEFVSEGSVVSGTSPSIDTKVPLVETVSGAPLASVLNIKVTAGAAYKSKGKTVYYGTVPKKCPKGGKFPLKSELIFDEEGAQNPLNKKEGTKPVTVVSEYKAPCPRK